MTEELKYFSKSSGMAIPIGQMETSHIQRALSRIKKYKTLRDKDEMYIQAFIAELEYRGEPLEMPFIELITGEISFSKVDVMLDCEAKFHFRYLDPPDEKLPKTTQMYFGSAIDHAQNEMMQEVIGGGKLPDLMDGVKITHEYLRENTDDLAEGVREETIDNLVQGTKDTMSVWYDGFATKVKPYSVQNKIELPLDDFIISGYLDFHGVITSPMDADGFNVGDEIIADLKVRGNPPFSSAKKQAADSVYKSMQAAFYCEAKGVDKFMFANVLRQKTQTQLQNVTGVIDSEHRQQWLNTARAARKRMRRLLMTGDDPIPNRNSNLCTKRWCEHWMRCEKKYGVGVRD